jgi:YVTN family beta-propeller protein
MSNWSLLAVCGLSSLLLTACGGSSSGSGGSGMDLVQMSNGFGVMVPYQVFKPDAQGNPTQEIVSIRSVSELIANVRPNNPILPISEWPVTPQLPNGDAGNHFVFLEFASNLSIPSVLSSSPSGQVNSGLTGTILVIAVDPSTNVSTPIRGRAFVGGKTYSGTSSGNPPTLGLETWVSLDSTGKPVANVIGGAQPGLGFPGTESLSAFAGAATLVKPTTFVFVVDTDGDLATHEMFPTNAQIRIQATTAVRATSGKPLVRQALGSSTVGTDVIAPEVAQTPPPNSHPDTIPILNAVDVDPLTDIIVRYTEPVQPLSVGSLPTGQTPPASPAISLTFGPSTSVVTVPFSILPLSVYDFSTWVLRPAFNFPGSGPDLFACGTFNTVTVTFNHSQVLDLQTNPNTTPTQTSFATGEGPGLVNAPVTPDAIYVQRGVGSVPGLSVIDLNGFGQSTGNPTFNTNLMLQGNSHFPYNPNLIQGSLMRPPLAPGSCTIDGGSAGIFTLTKDSSLNDLLLRSPVVTTVGDMALGWALDVVYNNGQEASGCQSGGGNICAIRGKKNISGAFGSLSSQSSIVPGNVPGLPGVGLAVLSQGGPNIVSWAPHPNPPALVFQPLCISPFIGGAEPTAFEVIQPPPLASVFGLGLSNLLTPGDPFGNPSVNLKPSGLLTRQQNGWFEGPSPVRPLNQCTDYMIRQQVGHFLYVIDNARREIVVLNSNRFTVIDRIPVADPTELAMSPNLDFLAVTSRTADSVTFIDIQPSSSTFHQIVLVLEVGRSPQGICWDPGNEDILVCNEFDNTVSIISVASLAVRKTVSSQLNRPFDVAIQQRSFNFGFFRNTYNAFILNRSGDIAVFESGPNGVNGWGYDDIIGVPPFTFDSPKRIQLDYNRINGSVWVLHENKLNVDGSQSGIPGGAVTNIVVDSAIGGQLPLNITSLLIPAFRDMNFKVNVSIGPDQLTGVPIDMALDDMVNLGGTPNQAPVQGAGSPLNTNGKSAVRMGGQNVVVGSKSPNFLFLAVPTSSEGPGVVDVIDINSPGYRRYDTNVYIPGVQSIPASGVSGLMDYWRQ